MTTEIRIAAGAVVAALLMPLAAFAADRSTQARINRICRSDFAAATTWSRSVPQIESDAEMAAWVRGVAGHFAGTAGRLRATGAHALATEFARLAAGNRAAAVAYLSGGLSRVNAANEHLRAESARAIKVARAAKAPACVAYVRNYRP